VTHAKYRSQLCSGAQERLAEVWDEPRAASIEAVFLATKVSNAADAWSRTRDGLDTYARRWTASHIEACEATRMRGEQSRELMDARMRCLQGRRRELSALIDTLAKADAAVVQKAVEAVTSLPAVDRCDDMAYVMAQVPPPDDPALEARVDDLRAQLAEARAMHAAGRYAEGLPIAQAITTQAEALGYVPLVAEAFRRLGALQEGTGAYEDAVSSFERAYFDALRSGMDELAAEAASALVFCLGYNLNRHDDALAWAAHARAEVDRAGTDEMLASLLNGIAVVEYHRGAYTQSKALHEEALAIQERVLGPNHTDVASTLSGLGNVHHALGSIDEAIALFERALALREQAVGTDHPSVAVAISNLGLALRAKASFDEAIRLQERALDMRKRLLGPEHPEVAASLSNLAGAHFSSGHHERAAELFEQALAVRETAFGRDHPKTAEMLNNLAATHAARGNHATSHALHQRALTIWENALGPDHPRVAMSLNNLGNVARELGNMEEAADLYKRALGTWEQALGPDHLHVSYPLVGLGDLWLALDRPREAIPLLERGLAIREARGAIPVELAGARFSLARALWDTPPADGRDRDRAHQLATQARDGLETSAPGDPLTAEIQTWLDGTTR
jgi:eukaryotic-like serine/threonine-protein kinase